MFIIKESREDVNHLTCEQKLEKLNMENDISYLYEIHKFCSPCISDSGRDIKMECTRRHAFFKHVDEF